MTTLESAKNNIITPAIRKVSILEGINPKTLLKHIKDGKTVIPLNKTHRIKQPCAIGFRLRTKVNANIGTSTDKSEVQDELRKLGVALKYGADTVMDLSVSTNLKKIMRSILKRSHIPVGTVPVY